MTTAEQHMPIPAELYADLERIAANATTWNRLMTTKAPIAQTPKALIWTLNKAKLYRYSSAISADKRHRVPLLLVFALINRPYILDLRPGNSFVEYMLQNGYDVYLLDWGVPGPEDKQLKLDDYVLEYLPRAIRKLSESYPGITVRVFDGVASTVAAMVKAGQVDFGISSQTYGDRELTSHVLMMDRLCAVVASNHPLARKRSMTLHELAKHPLILMVKDSSSRQIVDLAFDREGLVGNVAYETTYGTSVAGFTQAGLGIGILPESMAAPSRLHQLRIRGEKLTRRIGIVMRAGRSLSPTADRLKRTLESVVGARVGTPLAGNPVAKTSMTKGRGRD